MTSVSLCGKFSGSIQIDIGLPSLWQDIHNIWSLYVLVLASSFNSNSVNDNNCILWWWNWPSYAIHSYCFKARMLQRSYPGFGCDMLPTQWWILAPCRGRFYLNSFPVDERTMSGRWARFFTPPVYLNQLLMYRSMNIAFIGTWKIHLNLWLI